MTELEWLAEWFARQADGDWEHELGITIETLDNPGWSLRIDLAKTPLRDAPLVSEQNEDPDYWMRLWKDDAGAVFHGAGSPRALPAMIARFREWAIAASRVQ